VTAAQAGNANYYAAASVVRSISVNQAVLVVTADDKSKVYGQINPDLTYHFSGFVNEDTELVVRGSPKLSTAVAADSPAGQYSITISGGNLSAVNYTFLLVNGNMAVKPANTEASASDVSSRRGATSVQLGASVVATAPSTATVNEGSVTFTVGIDSGSA